MNEYARTSNQSKIVTATINSKLSFGCKVNQEGAAILRGGISPKMNVHHMLKSALKKKEITIRGHLKLLFNMFVLKKVNKIRHIG